MSRVANNPITLHQGLEVSLQNQMIKIKGHQGQLEHYVHPNVEVKMDNNVLTFVARIATSQQAIALAGTTRAIINNMVQGVSQGFEKKLNLVGVGYRAQIQGQLLNLTLGFSHPVNFKIPEGITIETPTQTEIVVKGMDKQKVGQVAANIRSFRPPEPYKGKGVKYSNEKIMMKETKKKK